MRVFGLIIFSCIWVYVWLFLVIFVILLGVVDFVEFIIIFLMFFVFIIGVYLIDKRLCMKKEDVVENGMVGIFFFMYGFLLIRYVLIMRVGNIKKVIIDLVRFIMFGEIIRMIRDN